MPVDTYEIDPLCVDYAEEQTLGQGEFGCVYAGKLRDHSNVPQALHIAVKVSSSKFQQTPGKIAYVESEDTAHECLLHEIQIMREIGP